MPRRDAVENLHAHDGIRQVVLSYGVELGAAQRVLAAVLDVVPPGICIGQGVEALSHLPLLQKGLLSSLQW